jgi:hypothetical protein
MRDAMDLIRGKQPNVDFALVSLRRALRLKPGSALSLFAISRTAGWIAHALEQQIEDKLIARAPGRAHQRAVAVDALDTETSGVLPSAPCMRACHGSNEQIFGANKQDPRS